MKKIILLLAVTSFFSCKTKEIIVEKTAFVKDSTEIVNLKNQNEVKEKQLMNLNEQLKASKQDNERLQANTNVSVKEFDTDKPNAPLKKEIVYLRSESSETESKMNLDYINRLTYKKDSTVNVNAELSKKISYLEKENKNLQSEKKSQPKFQWWLILVGLIVGFILDYCLGRFIYRIKRFF